MANKHNDNPIIPGLEDYKEARDKEKAEAKEKKLEKPYLTTGFVTKEESSAGTPAQTPAAPTANEEKPAVMTESPSSKGTVITIERDEDDDFYCTHCKKSGGNSACGYCAHIAQSR